MKLITITTAIMTAATPVLASGGEETGTSVLAILFLGFGALIIACQLIPSLMLFCSMLKGLFDSAVKSTAPKTETKTL